MKISKKNAVRHVLAAAVAGVSFLAVSNASATPFLDIVEVNHVHSANCVHTALNSGTSTPRSVTGTAHIESAGSSATGIINPNGTAGQLVWLDFSGSPTFKVALTRLDGSKGFFQTAGGVQDFTTHVYTQAEKDAIQKRMEADYAKFNVKFTQEKPTSSDYATVNLNNTAIGGVPNISLTEVRRPDGTIGYSISILFGRAQAIDFGNKNYNDYTGADANFWTFLRQAGFNFSGLSGLPNTAEGEAIAILNQAANTGAHELGHNLGLRHHDAFGPIGTGLTGLGGAGTPGNFLPAYPGPTAASESVLHTMASGASVGLSLAGGLADKFFGEREATKLAFNEQGTTVNEGDLVSFAPPEQRIDLPELFGNLGDGKGALSEIRQLVLQDLDVPLTATSGMFQYGGFDVGVASVLGHIDAPLIENGQRILDVDMYAFDGKANQILTIELMSVVPGLADPMLGQIGIFDEALNLISYFGTPATNIAEGESVDPLIFDLRLLSTGRYYIGIWSPGGVLAREFGLGNDTSYFSGDYNLYMTLTTVPEPAAMTLLLGGTLAAAGLRRRRRAA